MITALKKIFFSSRFTPALRSHSRNLHLSSCYNSYEGDGKTTVTILNKNFDYGVMIDGVSEQGFILNNNIRTIGPMIIFPKTMMSWNIASSADMNEESFSLLLHMEPKLDIVVIGLDDNYPYYAPFLQTVREIFINHKIPLEVLPIHQACSTFNYLNAECRYVAGALVPPRIKYVEDLLLGNKEKRKAIKEDISQIPLLGPQEKREIKEQISPAAKLEITTSIRNVNKTTYTDETLARQKEIEETFKIRSPWRTDDRPEPQYPVVGKKKMPKKFKF